MDKITSIDSIEQKALYCIIVSIQYDRIIIETIKKAICGSIIFPLSHLPLHLTDFLHMDKYSLLYEAGGIVITILWDDASVENIVMSDGFLEQLGSGSIHVSMSTVSPEMSKKLAAIHSQHGNIYIEAPIFGRPEAALAHKLSIPFAGPERAKKQIRPILKAMGGEGLVRFWRRT